MSDKWAGRCVLFGTTLWLVFCGWLGTISILGGIHGLRVDRHVAEHWLTIACGVVLAVIVVGFTPSTLADWYRLCRGRPTHA